MLLLTQVESPMLVAGQLQLLLLLLVADLAIVRIAFYEEDEQGDGDERETTGAEKRSRRTSRERST